DVEAHADRAAQRDLLGGVTADHGIVEIEIGERDAWGTEANVLDAALGEVRPQLAVFQNALRVVAAECNEVQVTLAEGENLRLRLLDDADLDASDLRNCLASHGAHEFLL